MRTRLLLIGVSGVCLSILACSGQEGASETDGPGTSSTGSTGSGAAGGGTGGRSNSGGSTMGSGSTSGGGAESGGGSAVNTGGVPNGQNDPCDPEFEPTLTLFLNYAGGTYKHRIPGEGANDVERRTFIMGDECQRDDPEHEYAIAPLTKTCRLDAVPPKPTEIWWGCDQGTCQGPPINSEDTPDGTLEFGRCSERDLGYEAAITAGVRDALAPYNVRVVSERPEPSVHYYTVLFTMNTACIDVYGGPQPGFAGNAAVQGCGILDNNEVFYASQATKWNWNPDFMINTVAHEFGHTAGLVHFQAGFMGGIMGSNGREYLDGCGPHDGNTACRSIHDQYCPGDSQNEHQLMLEVFGPAPEGGVWHESGVCGDSEDVEFEWPEVIAFN